MAGLPSCLEAAVCNGQRSEAHLLYPSGYCEPSRQSPTTVGMDGCSFSGTDNDGCEDPVNTPSSLIIDRMMIKKGRQLLVIRRSLMGDIVVNHCRFGRVGKANSWRMKQLSVGSGTRQDNGVVLE